MANAQNRDGVEDLRKAAEVAAKRIRERTRQLKAVVVDWDTLKAERDAGRP